jgi:hypothetical protein
VVATVIKLIPVLPRDVRRREPFPEFQIENLKAKVQRSLDLLRGLGKAGKVSPLANLNLWNGRKALQADVSW